MDREVAHRLGRLESAVRDLEETSRAEAVAASSRFATLDAKLDQVLPAVKTVGEHGKQIERLNTQLNMRTWVLGALSAIAGAFGLHGSGAPTP